jgi:hypothetical protein
VFEFFASGLRETENTEINHREERGAENRKRRKKRKIKKITKNLALASSLFLPQLLLFPHKIKVHF